MTELQDKNVLITGAASGIGRLLAVKIAALGGRVILWDINQEGLEVVCDQLQRWNLYAAPYSCDVTDRETIQFTARRVLAEQGIVDVVINNAGVVSGKSLLELSDEAIQRTFEINALACFWITRAFLPGMIHRAQGHIVTIASAAGIIGVPNMTDYCASKAAAIGFDDALRVELKHLGYPHIRTTVVCPYYISTGMFSGVKTRFPWLLPIMQPQAVADKILLAIQHNRRRLVLPPFAYVVYPGRLLPLDWLDTLARFFGISSSMDEFTGRGKRE
jgi:all-trans-retinol dehydrogenase (NAD+)